MQRRNLALISDADFDDSRITETEKNRFSCFSLSSEAQAAAALPLQIGR
jgi:hypothetical protein